MKLFIPLAVICALLSISPSSGLAKKLPQCPDKHPNIPSSAYNELRAKLSSKAKILFPNTPEYDAENKRWATNVELPAKAIIEVANARDVAASLTFVKEQNAEFAVLAGGHNMNKAASSTGIVIDLRQINHSFYRKKSQTVSVGPGLRWGALDTYLTPFNVSTVGGRVSDVGIGGFLTGGGIGWKTGQFSLGCDNIVSAEVVLANGKIIKASRKHNPEVFFGIRGGGIQFGVVTNFVLKTHPQPNVVWSGFLFYHPDQIALVAKAVEDFASTNQDKRANLIMFIASPTPGVPAPIIVTWFDGPGSIGKSRFKAFYDLLPFSDTTKDMTYAEGNTVQDPLVTAGERKVMDGATLRKITAKKILKAFDWYSNLTAAFPDAFKSAILFEPMFHSAFDNIKSKNAAWPHRSRRAFGIVGVNARWTNPLNDKVLIKKTREGAALLKKGEELEPLYPNYVLFGTPLKGIFQHNLPRLTNLKRKLDPTCLFNKGLVFDTPACRKCVKTN